MEDVLAAGVPAGSGALLALQDLVQTDRAYERIRCIHRRPCSGRHHGRRGRVCGRARVCIRVPDCHVRAAAAVDVGTIGRQRRRRWQHCRGGIVGLCCISVPSLLPHNTFVSTVGYRCPLRNGAVLGIGNDAGRTGKLRNRARRATTIGISTARGRLRAFAAAAAGAVWRRVHGGQGRRRLDDIFVLGRRRGQFLHDLCMYGLRLQAVLALRRPLLLLLFEASGLLPHRRRMRSARASEPATAASRPEGASRWAPASSPSSVTQIGPPDRQSRRRSAPSSASPRGRWPTPRQSHRRHSSPPSGHPGLGPGLGYGYAAGRAAASASCPCRGGARAPSTPPR
mmetsp:Transcript_77776/g.251997  ORF Transcript_77776/g.251997 Transcript_77776/m.251997 type:complete len:340 (+) Transcript_77776:1830-2849(+)